MKSLGDEMKMNTPNTQNTQLLPISQNNQPTQENSGQQINQFKIESDQSQNNSFINNQDNRNQKDVFAKEFKHNPKQPNLNNPQIDLQTPLQQNNQLIQEYYLQQIENLKNENQSQKQLIQQLTQISEQQQKTIQSYEKQLQGMNYEYQQLNNQEQQQQQLINSLIQELQIQKKQNIHLTEQMKYKEELFRQKNEAILNFKWHLYEFKDEIKNNFLNKLSDDLKKNQQQFEQIFEEKLPCQKIIRSILKWQDVIIFDKILSKQFKNFMINIQSNGSKKVNTCPTPGCNFCWIFDEKLKTDNSFCLNCELLVKATKTIINKQMIINEIQPDQSIPLPSYSNFEQNTSPKVNKEAAIDHRKATKIGRPNEKGRICQCCGLQIEREEFSLGVGTDQLGFLGSGYPMYFDFIKSCLVIIAIQYISVGNFLLITHIDKLFQLSQTEESLKEKQDVLSLTAIYFTMIYIIYFRHNQIKLDSFCDLKQTTPGDYTVLLQRLPSFARDDLEFKIKEEFENVVKVCFIYKQILNNQDNSRLFMEQLQDTYFEQNYFSGSALVSFKFKENKLQFLKKAKYNKFNYYLKQFLHLDLNDDGQINFTGLQILVRQAPEPTDINWKYLNEWIDQPSYKKYLEILLNFLLLILLLFITCTTKQKVNKFFTLKSFFTPIITIISYYIIPYLTKFINFRKYLSWTQTQKSLAYKMTILMSLFTIFISQFFNGEMFWLFICNSILPPLFLLMRPKQLSKNYKIQFGTLPQEQKELNQLYEYQNHHLTRNHAFINYTMIITNIYGTLMPINSIIAAIGLILYYWTDKYILLRHSTVRNQPSSTLSLEMYRLISFTPLMISCQHYINSSQDTLAMIQLISTLVFYFIPQDLVIKKIWKTKKLKEFAPYDEAQFNFCYDRTNPALQDKATQNWVTQQKKAHAKQKKVLHLLDEDQKDKLKKQLKKQLTKVQKLIGQMEAQLEQKQTTKLITQQDVSSSSQNKDHSDIVV